MKVHHKLLHLPKSGNSELEYQDAYYPLTNRDIIEGDRIRFAVADGASEAIYSGAWARGLVKAWGEYRLNFTESVLNEINETALEWSASIDRSELPWWAETKLEQGSFATLAGLELTADGKNRANWSATAVGDSCFFHIREGEVLEFGPITESAAFSARPYLIGTKANTISQVAAHTIRFAGALAAGDEFILLTDALSAWLVAQIESGKNYASFGEPLERSRDEPSAFSRWVERLRVDRVIRDDDVTYMWIMVIDV